MRHAANAHAICTHCNHILYTSWRIHCSVYSRTCMNSDTLAVAEIPQVNICTASASTNY
jgi:hypothetical protein